MKKIILCIFTALASCNIFCEQFHISIPNYAKMYSTENIEYILNMDSKGYITFIDFSDKRIFCEKEKLDYNGIELLATNKDLLVKHKNKFINFSCGVSLISYLQKENYQYKYEYQIDDDHVIVIYSNQMGDHNGLNCYDAFSEKIYFNKINLHNNNEKINITNFLFLYKMNISLAEVLSPFIFLDKIDKRFLDYNATSALREGNIIYSASNLSTSDGNPWASANGYGINDKIRIKMFSRSEQSLVVYNGFQSKEKPYLYSQNSRLKRIRICNSLLNKKKEIKLQDTKDAQEIDINDLLENAGEIINLEIEVLEVFAGDKYTDLCIQAILPKY